MKQDRSLLISFILALMILLFLFSCGTRKVEVAKEIDKLETQDFDYSKLIETNKIVNRDVILFKEYYDNGNIKTVKETYKNSVKTKVKKEIKTTYKTHTTYKSITTKNTESDRNLLGVVSIIFFFILIYFITKKPIS